MTDHFIGHLDIRARTVEPRLSGLSMHRTEGRLAIVEINGGTSDNFCTWSTCRLVRVSDKRGKDKQGLTILYFS